MENGTPIISPFASLLRNRQFVAAIVGALVTALINVMPMFEPARAELSQTVLLLFGLAIGGFSVVDAATAHGESQVKAAFIQSAMASGVNPTQAQNARKSYDAFTAKSTEKSGSPSTER